MSPIQCVKLLEQHQAWRRFDGDMCDGPTMLPPKVIGDAIDAAIEIVKQHEDLVLEKEELQRQLDERGGVLELHRIRVGELEEIIRLMKVIVNQLDCQLEAENAIREETEKLLDGYRDLVNEDMEQMKGRTA